MTRSLLPPDYARADVEMLYKSPQIKDGAKVFYIQLRGLAWGKESTPWLGMDELEEVTGKGHSAVWGYMSTLRDYRRLSWRTSGDGKFMFSFNSELLESGIPSTTTPVIESINLIKEEEEGQLRKRGVTPKTRSGAALGNEQVRDYLNVTGHLPTANQTQQVMEAFAVLRELWGDGYSVERLRPYYAAWCNSKRRDGTPYNKYSTGWLDWAMQGREVSATADDKKSNGAATVRERIQRARAAAQQGEM